MSTGGWTLDSACSIVDADHTHISWIGPLPGGNMRVFACFKSSSKRHRRGRRRGSIVKSGSDLVNQTNRLTIRTSERGHSPSNVHSPHASAFSEDEYYDALESPLHSPRSLAGDSDENISIFDRLTAWWELRKAPVTRLNDDSTAPISPKSPPVIPPDVPLEMVLEPEVSPNAVGCISMFSAASAALAHKKFLRVLKPKAGASMLRVMSVEDRKEAAAWEEVDASTFLVRSLHYMQTREKVPSAASVYRLLGVDMYSFDFKLFHIAQHIQLPEIPQISVHSGLPPLLVINLQLPTYPPTLFGANDGPGHSLVYYFGLPDGWEPSQIQSPAALQLLQRFFGNGREFDGQPTRDRLKLIGRIMNPEEWGELGPLSNTESRLLRNYNEKPLLTRPQHRFYSGPGYLEIDVDVHSYAYLAKKALNSFITRLAPVIFENGFVVQGNRKEELPEIVFGAARVYRVDFTMSKPFPAKSLEELGHGLNPDGEALHP